MTIDSTIDCVEGFCSKTIDKCSINYDNLLKIAYIVESGKTDVSSSLSDSFTNSCIPNGYGNDGWDNDCDIIISNSYFDLAVLRIVYSFKC